MSLWWSRLLSRSIRCLGTRICWCPHRFMELWRGCTTPSAAAASPTTATHSYPSSATATYTHASPAATTKHTYSAATFINTLHIAACIFELKCFPTTSCRTCTCTCTSGCANSGVSATWKSLGTLPVLRPAGHACCLQQRGSEIIHLNSWTLDINWNISYRIILHSFFFRIIRICPSSLAFRIIHIANSASQAYSVSSLQIRNLHLFLHLSKHCEMSSTASA